MRSSSNGRLTILLLLALSASRRRLKRKRRKRPRFVALKADARARVHLVAGSDEDRSRDPRARKLDCITSAQRERTEPESTEFHCSSLRRETRDLEEAQHPVRDPARVTRLVTARKAEADVGDVECTRALCLALARLVGGLSQSAKSALPLDRSLSLSVFLSVFLPLLSLSLSPSVSFSLSLSLRLLAARDYPSNDESGSGGGSGGGGGDDVPASSALILFRPSPRAHTGRTPRAPESPRANGK